MNYLCTFYTTGQSGWQDRSEYAQRVISSCREQGLDVTRFVWTYERLQESLLYKTYRDRFELGKCLCWWAWKPYIILNALIHMTDEDVLVMLDSDLGVGELAPFIAEAKQHKAVFIGHGHRNDNWTTGDCFYLMGCEEEKYYAADHIWGAVAFIKKCPETIAFVQDWLTCNLNLELMTSQGKYRPNRSGFRETRWIQGVLTNLAVKYGFLILDNGRAWTFSHPAVPLPMGG